MTTKLRLKGIVLCSFCRSEATNLDLYRQEPHYPGDLGSGECFLFLSRGLDQVIFVFKEAAVMTNEDAIHTVLDSRRLRLLGGTWHPYMLQDYAKQVGLHLIGIKGFSQIFEERRAEKRQLARKLPH
jgi:hypothetical protein